MQNTFSPVWDSRHHGDGLSWIGCVHDLIIHAAGRPELSLLINLLSIFVLYLVEREAEAQTTLAIASEHRHVSLSGRRAGRG